MDREAGQAEADSAADDGASTSDRPLSEGPDGPSEGTSGRTTGVPSLVLGWVGSALSLVLGWTGGVLVGTLKRVRTGYGPQEFVAALFGTFLVLTILFASLAASVVSGGGSITTAIGAGALLALVPTAWAGYVARKQANQRDRAHELSQQPSTETVGEAVELLSSDDAEARRAAAYVVSRVAEDGAGKVVKNSPVDSAGVVDRMADLLDDDTETRTSAAATLKQFALDYPDEVSGHEDAIVAAMGRPESPVQRNLVLAVGNLLYNRPDAGAAFVAPTTDLLDDDDHEVRAAACTALGYFEAHRDAVLPDLQAVASEDPNPEVTRAAEDAIQLLGASQRPVDEGETGEEGADLGVASGEFLEEPPDRDFSDVAGMADLKRTLRENVIEPFEGVDVYDKYGVGSDSGILFHGPPGTGKTHVATCLAGELDVNYVSLDVGDVESKFLGEGVESVEQAFAEARRNQPALVFIDEVDALAADRSSEGQHEDRKKVVNQLLQEVAEIDADDDLLVIAATNNPDDVDDAMLRTGRFDSKIEVPKPDAEARVEIFRHYLDGIDAPREEFDDDEIARATAGFVASDVEEVVRRAARTAANRERETGEETRITRGDVMDAIETVSKERGGVGQFVRSPPEVDFGDVAGMDELKAELHEKVIDPLENPETYEEYGLGIENGFLLYGPPGTGKTYVARALAGELDVSYVKAKTGDLVSKYIGEGAENVQRMFDEARENAPCLVFVDEIDALASDRSGDQQKSERQMVNQFLEELSQINDEDHDVVVIGATNTLEEVDDAMLRTGRFSEKIEVPPPDADARVEIFETQLEAPLDGFDAAAFADWTEGMVASDVTNVADRAARRALQRAKEGGERSPVTMDDVRAAVDAIDERSGSDRNTRRSRG